MASLSTGTRLPLSASSRILHGLFLLIASSSSYPSSHRYKMYLTSGFMALQNAVHAYVQGKAPGPSQCGGGGGFGPRSAR